jgi:hypothetical protein
VPILIIFAAAALFSTSALAAVLPITGSYGDAYGCKTAVIGWEAALLEDHPADWLLVTPSSIEGDEWGCNIRSVHGEKATLSCVTEGQPATTEHVSMRIDRAAGTLAYTDQSGTVTLHRCRS